MRRKSLVELLQNKCKGEILQAGNIPEGLSTEGLNDIAVWLNFALTTF